MCNPQRILQKRIFVCLFSFYTSLLWAETLPDTKDTPSHTPGPTTTETLQLVETEFTQLPKLAEVSAEKNPQLTSPPSEQPTNDQDDFEDTLATKASPQVNDPFQGWNRTMFNFNDSVFTWLAPVGRAYTNMPFGINYNIDNFLHNLFSPFDWPYLLMQRRGVDTLHSFFRFLINSTIGIFGIFDVATLIDLRKPDTNFGEVLASFGVPPGPYLVLPFLGGNGVRDSFNVLDTQIPPKLKWNSTVFDAYRWQPTFTENTVAIIPPALNGVYFYNTIKASSFGDLYSFIRNAQIQRTRGRDAELVADLLNTKK